MLRVDGPEKMGREFGRNKIWEAWQRRSRDKNTAKRQSKKADV